MTLDLDALEKLAMAATKGPWKHAALCINHTKRFRGGMTR